MWVKVEDGKKHFPVVFRSIFQLHILVTMYINPILFNGTKLNATKLNAISSDKVIVHRWLLSMQHRISNFHSEVMSNVVENSRFL